MFVNRMSVGAHSAVQDKYWWKNDVSQNTGVFAGDIWDFVF